MKSILKNDKLKKIILTATYLVFGVLFCVMPVKMFGFVESALCFVMLIVGVAGILIYSIMSSEDKEPKVLVLGIIGLVLAICMFLVPRLFGIILSLIIGFSGASMIYSELKNKNSQKTEKITGLVIGGVVTGLSIVTIVLSGTNVGKKIIAIFFGVMCLINGIYSLVDLILKLKQERKLKAESKAMEPEVVKESAETEEQKETVEEKPQETLENQSEEDNTQTEDSKAKTKEKKTENK